MKRQPDMYLASALKDWPNQRQLPSKIWVPARGAAHNAFGWTWRFKLAWDVLTGQCDAVYWDDETYN